MAMQMTTNPTTRPATLDLFPEQLKTYPQWVLWKLEEREGKLTKVPYQVTGVKASTTDPATWTTYSDAATHQNGYAGVGIVVTRGSGFIFLDLDHCVSPDGAVDGWAQEIVDALDSYAELSPSRRGLHIWVRGVLPPDGRRRGSVEMYDCDRYGTVTGWQMRGTPNTVSSCDLAPMHARMMANEFDFSKAGKVAASPVPSISATTITVKDKFLCLQSGDWQQFYSSQNDADLALCRLLSRDLHTAEEIDSAFRRSGLMRAKWDRKWGNSTYGARTIAKVLVTPERTTPTSAPATEIVTILRHEDIPDPRGLSASPVRHLVEGLIPANMYTIIAGEYGVGKSWLGMMLSQALARGERFLGRETRRCERVTYFDRENPLAVIQERMVSLFGEQGEQEESAYRHWGLWLKEDPPSFDSPRYHQFAAVAESVLIFDSFTRFHNYNENSPTEMALVSAHLRKLQSLGATVIVLHHRDKALISDFRGTAEIAAGCDVMYRFSKEKENLRMLKLAKSRTMLDDSITFRMDLDLPTLIPTENPQLSKRRDHCALISAMLRDHLEGVQQQMIIHELEQKGISRSQTRRYLDAHEGKLWISKGGGRGVPKTYHARIVIR